MQVRSHNSTNSKNVYGKPLFLYMYNENSPSLCVYKNIYKHNKNDNDKSHPIYSIKFTIWVCKNTRSKYTLCVVKKRKYFICVFDKPFSKIIFVYFCRRAQQGMRSFNFSSIFVLIFIQFMFFWTKYGRIELYFFDLLWKMYRHIMYMRWMCKIIIFLSTIRISPYFFPFGIMYLYTYIRTTNIRKGILVHHHFGVIFFIFLV